MSRRYPGKLRYRARTRLLLHAYSYTPTLARLLLHAYSYTPSLTRLLLHAYSYTPNLARLLLQVYSYIGPQAERKRKGESVAIVVAGMLTYADVC